MRTALERVYTLMQLDLVDDSPESDALAIFIEHYEAKQYPTAPPTPLEAINFLLDQLGQ